MQSKLVFAASEDTTEDQDLHAWEIYNLQLAADLVVLSACETGTGKLVRGEGLMSLAQAFHYANCPSVVTSLWPVDDDATAILMEYFYKALSEGLPKDQALQQAKLQYLEQSDPAGRHPFYWSSFVLLGDQEPISTGFFSFGNVLYILTALVVLVGLLVFYYILKVRKPTANGSE